MKFKCPTCDKVVAVKDGAPPETRIKVECPHCQQLVRLTTPRATKPNTPPLEWEDMIRAYSKMGGLF